MDNAESVMEAEGITLYTASGSLQLSRLEADFKLLIKGKLQKTSYISVNKRNKQAIKHIKTQ